MADEEIVETQEEAVATAEESPEEAAPTDESLATSFAEAFPEDDVPEVPAADAKKKDATESGTSAEEVTSDAGTEGEGVVSKSGGQEEAKDKDKPQPKIPYSRFARAIGERNEAREKLAEERGRRLAVKETSPKPQETDQGEDDSEEPYVATRGEFRKALEAERQKGDTTLRQQMAMSQFNSDMRFFHMSERMFSTGHEDYQKVVHDVSEAFPEGFYAAINPQVALRDRNDDGTLTDASKEILGYWDEIFAADDPAEYLMEFASQAQGIQASPSLDDLDISDEETLGKMLGKLGVTREKYEEMKTEGTVVIPDAPQEKKPAKQNKGLRTVPGGKKIPTKGPADQEQTFNDTFPKD